MVFDHKRASARRRIANSAQSRVSKAIRRGLLPALDGSIKCVDCGAIAAGYDHREYAKPLQVEPVCRICNAKRGPAIDAYTALFPKKTRASGGIAPS